MQMYAIIVGVFITLLAGGYAYLKVLEWRIRRQEATNQALMVEYKRLMMEKELSESATVKTNKARTEAAKDLQDLTSRINAKDYGALDRTD